MNKFWLSTPGELRPEFADQYRDVEDPYGFDLDCFSHWETFFRFFYQDYYHVQTIGIENIPADGRAVLVGNHSGGLPVDALMTNCANYNLHPHPRRVRCLALDSLFKTPVVGDMIKGMGAVPARFETAQELLENGELVFFYPEGPRGTGKPISQRYRLIDFDPGFAKAAIATSAPIVPITVIGADEIFPIFAKVKSLARLLHIPYFPLTPSFPWLPITTSSIPLPIKMLIVVGKPVYIDCSPEQMNDHALRLEVARRAQHHIQRQLNFFLSHRKSPLEGWDLDWLRKVAPARTSISF